MPTACAMPCSDRRASPPRSTHLLGYEAATALVAEAIATGTSIPELVRRSALIDDAVLARVLSVENLCWPNDPRGAELQRERS